MMEVVADSAPSESRDFWVIETTTTVCARLLVSFIEVAAMLRFVVPSSILSKMSLYPVTMTLFKFSAGKRKEVRELQRTLVVN